MQNAMASAERIFVLLDNREQDAQELPATSVPAAGIRRPSLERIESIHAEDVRFAYVEGEPVLRGVSFHVRCGETLAIVGPTGSGKTTLINLLIRFYDPTGGCIRINGVDTRRFDKKLLRSRMALVMQDPFLFSSTIRSNIFTDGADSAPRNVDRILELARCRDIVARLPEGLDTVLSEAGGSLSSGERQLVSIARAFAADPQLIILDEATSYIDSATEQKIQEALYNLVHDRTALVVAHRLSTARTADRILVLHRGEVVEAGSHDALMARQGFYYHLYGLQG
jgi:ATP-binding cassette subfamily B protein